MLCISYLLMARFTVGESPTVELLRGEVFFLWGWGDIIVHVSCKVLLLRFELIYLSTSLNEP